MKIVFSPITKLDCPHCKADIPLRGLKHMDQCVCGNCEKKVFIPALFEDYLVYDKMSSCPHSVNYRGFNQSESRPCVLKVVKHPADSRMATVFVNMHRRLMKLKQPNLNSIFRIGEHEGVTFIEEALFRRSLHHLFSRGGLSEEDSLTFVRDAASALAVVHGQLKICHLNLNSKTIRINREGMPIISDFNHHRLGEPQRKLIGAPKYVSPEAILFATNTKHAGPPGIQADIFSLGVILYRLLSNRSPYNGDAREMLKSRFKSPPTPLSELADVSVGTLEIVERMMAVRPADRYQSMPELFEALTEQISHFHATDADVDEHAEVTFSSEGEIDLMADSTPVVETSEKSEPEAGDQEKQETKETQSEEDPNLFVADMLEYAAPADESINEVMINYHMDMRNTATQKVEMSQAGATTSLQSQKTQVSWPKVESLRHSMEQPEEIYADSVTDLDIAMLSQIATDTKMRLAGATHSQRERNMKRKRKRAAQTFWIKVGMVFLIAVVGGSAGYLIMEHLSPKRSPSTPPSRFEPPVAPDPMAPVKSVPVSEPGSSKARDTSARAADNSFIIRQKTA